MSYSTFHLERPIIMQYILIFFSWTLFSNCLIWTPGKKLHIWKYGFVILCSQSCYPDPSVIKYSQIPNLHCSGQNTAQPSGWAIMCSFLTNRVLLLWPQGHPKPSNRTCYMKVAMCLHLSPMCPPLVTVAFQPCRGLSLLRAQCYILLIRGVLLSYPNSTWPHPQLAFKGALNPPTKSPQETLQIKGH